MTDGKAMTLGNLVNMQESHPELFEKWQLTIEVARYYYLTTELL